MPPASTLSVVIPTRNTCDLTLACLTSLTRESAGLQVDVLLVDDGGEDGTAEQVRSRFPSVTVVRVDESQGFTKAANAGLRLAQCELLLVLNSDTELQPGSLRALVDAFAGDTALGIAGAYLLNRDGSPQWSGSRTAPGDLWLFAEASGLVRQFARLPLYRRVRPLHANDTRVAWVSGAALAMRRDVWGQVGPFDERFRLYAQDLDLCVRAGAAGWTVRIVPGFDVIHHQGATVAQVQPQQQRRDASLLWTDLVRWVGKHSGEQHARRAARILAVGAQVRLLARRVMTIALSGEQRSSWIAETQALDTAARAVRSMAS